MNHHASQSPLDVGRRFQRKREDFVCEKCGTKVSGDGFTNHCPACLWSKHVDVHPGDRAASCGGLMEPVALEKIGESWKITHRCGLCGQTKKNKSESSDSFDTLVSLAQKFSKNRN